MSLVVWGVLAVRIIIEMDGPIIDVEPIYWAAYSRVVGELGLARKEQAVFWRALRRGSGVGDMLAGAKPRHIQQFREALPQALEHDECLAAGRAWQDVAKELNALHVGQHVLGLVTLGSNARARQKLLDEHDLSVHFTRMVRLADDPFRRLAQLEELAEDHRRVLVAAGSETLVKLANEAGLLVVGISNGPCVARRLTQAGASLTFGDFVALAEEIETGASNLISAGLLPP
ncbi:MAG: HAD family hydrolase [Phycisphaerae bacterium]|nr:HAD family hydrolase [Phycisphaerae bacterium]